LQRSERKFDGMVLDSWCSNYVKLTHSLRFLHFITDLGITLCRGYTQNVAQILQKVTFCNVFISQVRTALYKTLQKRTTKAYPTTDTNRWQWHVKVYNIWSI